jgi:hypothetical protein
MIIPTFPTKEEIQKMILRVEFRLKDKRLNQKKNFPIKEGFLLCVELLNEYLEKENSYFRANQPEELEVIATIYKAQLEPVKQLKTVVGRTIAVMCIDWLNGVKDSEKFVEAKIHRQ